MGGILGDAARRTGPGAGFPRVPRAGRRRGAGGGPGVRADNLAPISGRGEPGHAAGARGAAGVHLPQPRPAQRKTAGIAHGGRHRARSRCRTRGSGGPLPVLHAPGQGLPPGGGSQPAHRRRTAGRQLRRGGHGGSAPAPGRYPGAGGTGHHGRHRGGERRHGAISGATPGSPHPDRAGPGVRAVGGGHRPAQCPAVRCRPQAAPW